jgi:hypothetical protein
MAWGEDHRRRTVASPNRASGRVHGVAGLQWTTIDTAPNAECRAPPRGSSLAKLFGSRPRQSSTPASSRVASKSGSEPILAGDGREADRRRFDKYGR